MRQHPGTTPTGGVLFDPCGGLTEEIILNPAGLSHPSEKNTRQCGDDAISPRSMRVWRPNSFNARHEQIRELTSAKRLEFHRQTDLELLFNSDVHV
ncbi:hypothetical protein [Paludisphaera rhizosphaerae]|uniref:hypothetical protein n=1 Tax=Paludisphaera rhizosphaerae TaxID=2711216 RepID=UPI0019811025|nr:hypothetical protein [Paludisphaera rhizosphaerae]